MSDYQLFYDRDGNPVDLDRGIELLGEDRRVAYDACAAGEVSTVFLPVNQGYLPGEPLLFETMITRAGSGEQRVFLRYRTETEATHGHTRLFEALRSGEDLLHAIVELKPVDDPVNEHPESPTRPSKNHT